MDQERDPDGHGARRLACAILVAAHRDAALDKPPATAWPWPRWRPGGELGRFFKSAWFEDLVAAAGLEHVDAELARAVLSKPPAGGR